MSYLFPIPNLKSESTEKLGRMGGAGFHIIVSKNGIFFQNPRRSLNLRHSLNLRIAGKILLPPAPFNLTYSTPTDEET